MKKITTILAIVFGLMLFTDCKENDDTPTILGIDFVGFESDFQIGVDPTGNTSQEVKIAVSQASGADRSFNLSVNADMTTADPSAYSVPSTVTIPANSTVGSFMVDVVGANVNPSGDDVVVLDITNEAEGLFKSAPITLNLKQVCPNPELILDITFDNWPEEIYWRIVNAAGDTVFESATPAGFGAYDGLTGGISRNICLASGSYTFNIFDGFEDGAGPYSLTFDGAVIYTSDGGYGAGESVPFTIP